MFFYHFIAIITTTFVVHFRMAKTDASVCNNLIQKLSSSETNILAIGKLNSKIFLITKDFYIFELPSDALKGKLSSSTLHLDSNPEPMSKKWPVLWNDKQFMEVKNCIRCAITVKDVKSEYIPFVNKQHETCRNFSLRYDITRNKVNRKYLWQINDNIVLISAMENMTMYGISMQGNGLIIDKYMIEKNDVFYNHETARLCAVYDDINNKSNKLPGKIKVAFNCEHEFIWPVNGGFEDAEQFYLFGPKSLLIFSNRVTSKRDFAHELVEMAYDAFFVCSSKNPSAQKSGIIKGSIGFIIILLGVLLLTILLFSYRKHSIKKTSPVNESYEGTNEAGTLKNKTNFSKIFESAKMGKSCDRSKSNKGNRSRSKSRKTQSITSTTSVTNVATTRSDLHS